MKLKVLAVGKIKKEAFLELAKEYQRRIQHFHPFEVIEIPDEKISQKRGEKEEQKTHS